MAVYTHLSDEQIEEIRMAFGLSEITLFKGIAEGVQNSNFLIETNDNRYVLTIYEAMTDVSELPFFLGATEHAAQAGLKTALPIHTESGDLVYEIAGKKCALCTFLKGVSPKTPNAEQVKSAGRALAQLHLANADLGLARANNLGHEAWRAMWNKIADRAGGFETELLNLIAEDLALIDAKWPMDIPKGFIHADLFPDNVMFIGNEVSGLIDFYFAATDSLAYDLAIMLNAWCFLPLGREFDLTKGRALIAGYESIRPLTDKERAAMPILCLGAAMRFFLTRMADWLTEFDGAVVNKKDPKEYTARLAFHRSAHSIFDYGG